MVLKTATTISSKYNSIRLLYLHIYILTICISKLVGGALGLIFKKLFSLIFMDWLVHIYWNTWIQVNNIERKSLHDSHEGLPFRCPFTRHPAGRSVISWHLQLLHLWNLPQHLRGSHALPGCFLPMAEHSGLTRAEAFLPNMRLFSGESLLLGFTSTWLRCSQSRTAFKTLPTQSWFLPSLLLCQIHTIIRRLSLPTLPLSFLTHLPRGP